MNVPELDRQIFEFVEEKAKALERHFDSDVVWYSGQIHPAFFRLFRNFIEEVKKRSKRDTNSITIFLRTPGGSVETTERYVGVIRKHYKFVNFVVPDAAMSAGTILCMSGDKIYMDYSSSLGPIDPQVQMPDGNYVAALGYLDKVRELTEKPKLSPADVVFLKGLDLARLALYEQAKRLSESLLKYWLVKYKFNDWKQHRTTSVGQAVTDQEKEARAQQIANALSDHSRWFSHGRALDVGKLKDLRLEIDDYSGDDNLRSLIRAYNDLLATYMDRMNLQFYLHNHLMEAA